MNDVAEKIISELNEKIKEYDKYRPPVSLGQYLYDKLVKDWRA